MEFLNVAKKQWDRLVSLVLTIVGAVMLISGWVGVSGTNVLSEQSPYIVSGGLGGIFLLGIGATLWISADLRDEWRKLDRIEIALSGGVLRWDDGQDRVFAAELLVEETQNAHAANGSRSHAAVVGDV
ncbi:MAG TPA: hypothetical protein VHX38_33045 [Pseudonocardiaceae bacterium]|nr:hypothetical protein [Pseudonocardiaceae bacterium]